jgi:hypothetical protein
LTVNACDFIIVIVQIHVSSILSSLSQCFFFLEKKRFELHRKRDTDWPGSVLMLVVKPSKKLPSMTEKLLPLKDVVWSFESPASDGISPMKKLKLSS